MPKSKIFHATKAPKKAGSGLKPATAKIIKGRKETKEASNLRQKKKISKAMTPAGKKKGKVIKPEVLHPDQIDSKPRTFLDMGKGGPLLRKLLQSPRMREMMRDFAFKDKKAQAHEDIQLDTSTKPMDMFNKMGFFDAFDTSSSPAELNQYKERLEYRADWLEVLLEDTLMEMEQIEKILSDHTSRDGEGEPGN